MEDKEKVWFEFRVNVDKIRDDEVPLYLSYIGNNLAVDDTVKIIVVPVKKEKTRYRLVYNPSCKRNKFWYNLVKSWFKAVVK